MFAEIWENHWLRIHIEWPCQTVPFHIVNGRRDEDLRANVQIPPMYLGGETFCLGYLLWQSQSVVDMQPPMGGFGARLSSQMPSHARASGTETREFWDVEDFFFSTKVQFARPCYVAFGRTAPLCRFQKCWSSSTRICQMNLSHKGECPAFYPLSNVISLDPRRMHPVSIPTNHSRRSYAPLKVPDEMSRISCLLISTARVMFRYHHHV